MEYPSIRLYYPGGKAGSFGTLAEGYLRAFRELGIKHAAFDYREPPDEDGFGVGGSNYDIGLYLGEPTHLNLMHIHTSHKERLVMVAPNGLGIPDVIGQSCKAFGVKPLSPSEWGARIVAKATGMPVEVAPHGVHVQLNGPPQLRPRDPGDKLRLLHFTSTSSDRKGTLTLLEAMKRQGVAEAADLVIHCDPLIEDDLLDIVSDLPIQVSRHIDVQSWPIENDGSYGDYLLSFDAVVQPSRAEGFGLVPLEAASVGRPAILTPGTGHDMYTRDIYQIPLVYPVDLWGTVFDEEGYGMIDGEPYPVMGICEQEVADAILYVHRRYDHMSEWALAKSASVREKWSWTNVVKKWLEGRQA